MIINTADRLQSIQEYYFVKKLTQVRELKEQGHHVLNFGIGSPDLDAASSVTDKLSEAGKQKGVHGYQPYKGLPELRSAIAQWYEKTYRVSLDSREEVMPLMGSKEGILHLLMAFVNPGEAVLIPDPSYPTYASLTKLTGANPVFYTLSGENDWLPDFEELTKLVQLHHPKVLFANYPHMPTGRPFDKEVIEKLVDFCKRSEILLIHDNPYSLVLNSAVPQSIFNIEGAKDVAVELNSLSKSHNMAGWRIGMLTGKSEYINAALKVKSNIDSGMFYGTQQAAIEALQLDDDFHLKRNEIYQKRKRAVLELISHFPLTVKENQEGMFVWARINDEHIINNIDEFIDRMLFDYHMFITPGKIFGKNGENYLRFSLCVDVEDIKEAILRLENNPL